MPYTQGAANDEFWVLNVELFSAKVCDCELVNYELYHELIGDDSQLARWGARLDTVKKWIRTRWPMITLSLADEYVIIFK